MSFINSFKVEGYALTNFDLDVRYLDELWLLKYELRPPSICVRSNQIKWMSCTRIDALMDE